MCDWRHSRGKYFKALQRLKAINTFTPNYKNKHLPHGQQHHLASSLNQTGAVADDVFSGSLMCAYACIQVHTDRCG